MPYAFLSPAHVGAGAGATAAVVGVLGAAVVALGAALSSVHRLLARRKAEGKADEGRREGLLG